MQATSSPTRSTKKIVYLDYLRIFACLGVFACHLWVAGVLPNLSRLAEETHGLAAECLGIHGDALYRCGLETLFLVPHQGWDALLLNGFNVIFGLGYQAVPLFFILSGFGLTLSALSSEKKSGQIRWFDFLKKRFFRLYPSYWLVLGIYLLMNCYQYPSFLGWLKTYVKGAVVLDVIPATWYIPILLQLYLLFPMLFWGLKKLSTKGFLLVSFWVKVVSSAVIIMGSLLAFDRIVGFGFGALAPGGIALPRLFEFCLGMAIAKYWVKQGGSSEALMVFRKLPVLAVGGLSELAGVVLASKAGVVQIGRYEVPIGLFVSDALIGVGVFILALNGMFWLENLLKGRQIRGVELVSNGTYEAYLLHGAVLAQFISLGMEPVLKSWGTTVNYGVVCLVYLGFLAGFSAVMLSMGCYVFNLKSVLLQKWALLWKARST